LQYIRKYCEQQHSFPLAMPKHTVSIGEDPDEAFVRAATFLGSTVCVLSGRTGAGAPFGLTVSCVFSASIDPPLLVASIHRESGTLSPVLESAALAVHVLREGQGDLAKAFGNAATAARELALIGGAPEAPPRIPDALARFDCRADSSVVTGDHTLVVLRVERAESDVGTPLFYWRRGLYGLNSDHAFLASEDTFDAFVREWRAGTLPRARWTHAAHVAVAAHHSFHFGADAYEQMRAGILHFNQCCGIENTETSGYHETLTRFWSELIATFVSDGGFASAWDAATAAVAEFGHDRDAFRTRYDFDVLASREARRQWIPPRL
jgi:flavin reductase (DIM6/NTAB) family NADH-FMN oxidoreductase RutF